MSCRIRSGIHFGKKALEYCVRIRIEDISWGNIRRRYLTQPTLLRLVPTSTILVVGIVLNVWTHSLLSEHRDLVVHTHEAIEMTKDVLIGLDDAETGERGYLLSGDRRYLDPYFRASERLAWMAPALRAHISDNSEQVGRMDKLSGLMQQKLDELRHAIDLFDSGGLSAARPYEIQMMERATMDTIRRVIGDITDKEKTLLNARGAEVDASEDRVRAVAILIALLSLTVRGVVELYLGRKAVTATAAITDPSNPEGGV